MRRTVLAALVLVAAATEARAEGGRFGAGLSVGSPTGISLKLYLDSGRSTAIDLGAGAAVLGAQGFQVHADHLWHPFPIAEEESFRLTAYGGVGGRVLAHEKAGSESDIHVGARFVGGVVFLFQHVPLDAFVEGALLVDLFGGEDESGGPVGLGAAMGVRYYF